MPPIVAIVEVATAVVLTVNVAVVAPAATVTLAGSVAEPLLLDRVTTAPPAGARLPSVTVPVEEPPPVTDAGFTDTDASTGGLMVRGADCVPLNAALILAVVMEATAEVFTVNVAVVAFAATVTLEDTVADGLSLESATTAPPAGAGLLNVMVPVDAAPPATVAGFRATEETTGGLIVRGAD